MKSARAQILEWAEQGALSQDRVDAALRLAGVTPDEAGWRRSISTLLLWLGSLSLAAGVIFFFAYNWDAIGRFQKFALVEVPLACVVAVVLVIGPDRAIGKAALLFSALLTGALLALIGQTYQTGADTFELFVAWAVLILPWVAVSRQPVMWLLFIALLNLASVLYFVTFPGFFGLLLGDVGGAWAVTLLNTLALAVWEIAAARGVTWLRERWAIRLVAALAGITVTVLGVWAIVEPGHTGPLAIPVYILWLIGAYQTYRRRVRDLFVLAGGVLSAIVFVTAAIARQFFRSSTGDAGALLVIAIVVLAMSAGGGWWLRQVAAEEGE